MVSRRVLLGGALGGAVVLAVGAPYVLGSSRASSTGTLLRSQLPLPEPFRQRLTIPKVLAPDRSDAAADHYTITQQQVSAEVIAGHRTTLWTYGGTFPGPTIESRRGRTAIVKHVNRLPVPTVAHLHGGRTPAESDGYPLDYLYPADLSYYQRHMRAGMKMPEGDVRYGSREYTYPLQQRAATLWYHDHRMDFTGPSVWRGLAGFHLVRDAEEDALHLPSGPYELPLMVTDRAFAADGTLRYPSLDPTLVNTPGVAGDYVAGVLGDVVLVNGVPWPATDVARGTYRLRILNACNARRLSLRFDPAPRNGIVQIGTDGGLLAAPITHDHLELAPAQRLDVLVDFSHYAPGTQVTMRNDFGDGSTSKVMRFTVSDRQGASFEVPKKLSTVAPLGESDAVRTRTFQFKSGDMGHWLIDSRPFSPSYIAAEPKLGTVEVWRLLSDLHHPVHLHLNPFQVLSRGTGDPGAFDAGWKDTVDLRPAEEVAIAVRFDAYRGKYVFHCHNLEHEDMAMMSNFRVG